VGRTSIVDATSAEAASVSSAVARTTAARGPSNVMEEMNMATVHTQHMSTIALLDSSMVVPA